MGFGDEERSERRKNNREKLMRNYEEESKLVLSLFFFRAPLFGCFLHCKRPISLRDGRKEACEGEKVREFLVGGTFT